jgi:Ulp1 protease family, C-terminal catalytic domain
MFKRHAAPKHLYDAARIAIGEKVYVTDCNVALNEDGFLWVACREESGIHMSGKFNLRLDDAVQEVKYFLLDDNNDNMDGGVILDVDADSHHDDLLLERQEEDYLSFLLLKINESCAGNYKKPTSDSRRLPIGTYTILIDFRVDSEIKEFLKVLVRIVGGSKLEAIAFTTAKDDDDGFGARLSETQAEHYGRVFVEHSQEEMKRRLAIKQGKASSKSNNKVLQDKGENDILLVYPIAGGDAVEIDAAANGLNEVRGPAIVPAVVPVDAAAAAIAASSESCESNDCIATEVIVVAEAEAGPTVTNKPGRTHNVTIHVGDYMRLEPKEYLNDSLIDFWMRWIMRRNDDVDGEDKSMMHIFSTHFFTSMVDNGPDGVTNWTVKKNINIFEKKLLFIPINKTMHWSMVVVVNPRHIVNMEKPDEAKEDDPASFLLFFDSLRAHQIAIIAKRIRAWLNSEWKRLKLNLEFERDDPFSPKTMVVYNPTSTWCRGRSSSNKSW